MSASRPPFSGIRACVFDAYGTLLDFNSAAATAADTLGDRAAQLSELWRGKQLQYTWLRALMGAHAPFWQVTGDALDYAMAVLEIDDAALRGRLMDAYLRLATFPDVLPTLHRLRRAGMKTAILTNGSPDMIESACKHAGLDALLDAVLSVEEVGIFKPHPDVYRLAVDRLMLPARQIAFVSSNAWDAAGAAQFGFRVAWCNRYRQPPERLPGRPEAQIDRLDALLPLLGPTEEETDV